MTDCDLCSTLKSAPGPVTKDFQGRQSCCLLLLKTNAPTRASRPRTIENLGADAVLTPTASGLPLRLFWRVSTIKSFFMVRSDTMVFSRLVDRERKPARLEGAEPGRRRPVAGEARPSLTNDSRVVLSCFPHNAASLGSPHTNAIHSSPSPMPRQLASQSSMGLLPAT